MADDNPRGGGRVHVHVICANTISHYHFATPKTLNHLRVDLEATAENSIGILTEPQPFIEWKLVGIDELGAGRFYYLALALDRCVAVLDQNNFKLGHTCN